MSDHLPSRVIRFGGFALDVSAYQLLRRGRAISIERRPMELLMMLVARHNEIVTRDEIVERLWGRDVFIDVGSGVNTVVRKVRRALRDNPDHPRFIQTVQGKGYRFIANLESAAHTVVAVLPFTNLQGDAQHEYVADGLTEETIVGLGRIDPERLSVIGRTTSMQFRSATKTLDEVGRQLSADYLVEGTLRAAGGRYRITSSLIRARDQVQVWTESYDRDAGDLLTLQSELGSAIAHQIGLRLSGQRPAQPSRQTKSPQAFDLYLRGRYFFNQMTQATAARALECLRAATDIDPAYGLAWAGIADTYSSLLFNSDVKASDVATDAREAAAQAGQHGDAVAEAHCAVGTVHLLFDWHWPAAEMSLRRAIALDSSSSQSHWMLGHALSLQGRHADARDAARRARDLDPLNPLSHSMSAQIAFAARNLDAAARHALDAIHAEPNDWVAHWQLGQAYEQMDRLQEALEEFAEASRLSNGNTKPVSVSAYTLARNGRRRQAQEILESLEGLAQQRYVPPCALALIHAGLNDEDKMLECLERALAVRDVHLIYVPHDSKWDPFRGSERMKRLIQLCGFSPPGDSASTA
jgi:TolB-like protein/Tfp pilus assembly protein PilF